MAGVENSSKNRGKYRIYTQNDLENAIKEIKSEKVSVVEAQKKYNIPIRTLRNRINPENTPKARKPTILEHDDENRLAKYVLLHAELGNPLTSTQIMKLAGEIATLNTDPAKQFKKGVPSLVWLNTFIKRHPEISRRTPSALGRASAHHNVDDLKNFFDNVRSYFEKENLLYLLDRPESWWNADESGFELNPTPKKVYARKGKKNVYCVERGNPKEMVTATYCFAADGNFIEPLLTFKSSSSKIVEIAVAAGCEFKYFERIVQINKKKFQLLELILDSTKLSRAG